MFPWGARGGFLILRGARAAIGSRQDAMGGSRRSSDLGPQSAQVGRSAGRFGCLEVGCWAAGLGGREDLLVGFFSFVVRYSNGAR